MLLTWALRPLAGNDALFSMNSKKLLVSPTFTDYERSIEGGFDSYFDVLYLEGRVSRSFDPFGLFFFYVICDSRIFGFGISIGLPSIIFEWT